MVRALAGLATLLLLFGVSGVTASIAASSAGSLIVNRAQMHSLLGTETQRLDSNEVSNRIDEVLGVSLIGEATPQLRLESHADAQPVAFLLRNDGNGNEAFLISVEVSGDTAVLRAVALDSNDDGRFDPAIDTIFGPNDPTRPIEPGATLRLFALLDVADEGQGSLVVRAQSVTGTGTPGTLFAGRGEGGTDALTGPTRAEASVALDLAIAGSSVALVKSQQILAADGGGLPVRGALIRYVIEARLAPGAVVTDARIVDPVPTGTTYVPGSLTLDGTTLSEAPDGDPGLFRDNVIEVAIGDLVAAPVRTIAFDVKIN